MPLRLPNLEWVSVDTESSGTHPDDGARCACVGLAWPGGELALPFDQGERDKYEYTQLEVFDEGDPNLGEEEWVELLDWLAGRKLVFHHAKHDLTILKAGTRHWEGRDLVDAFYWDTLLVQRELDPIEPADLDAVARRLGLGEKKNLEELKQWLKRKRYPTHRYDLVPWAIIQPYVTEDARMTAVLHEHQLKRVGVGGAYYESVQRGFALLRVLYGMEARGVGYDSEASLEAADALEADVRKLVKKVPFDATTNGAKAWFFDKQGLEPERYTGHGAPSLDAEQLRRWVEQGVKWAPEFHEIAKKRRAVSMWYRGYPEKLGLDGRLRCEFKQSSTKFGRLAVGRVQLQAIPKEDKMWDTVPHVRALLQPKKGHKLWNLDLSQAELRVAAKYSGCERMLKLLAEGADLHGDTCQEVLNVDPKARDWKVKRDIAKRINFASIFQVGGETFQRELAKQADIILPLNECERYINAWRHLYPEFGIAYQRAEKLARNRHWIRQLPNTEYERRSFFAPFDDYAGAWSRIVQGSLAEFLKLWLVEIERDWPGLMILTVHDSVLLEVPSKYRAGGPAKEVAARGAELATELFGIEMKIDVSQW